MDLKEWLKTNNYELITLTSKEKGFYINPKDRGKVFDYLEDNDILFDWDYRGNYTYILILLKGVE